MADIKDLVAKTWYYLLESPLDKVGLLTRPGLRFVVISAASFALLRYFKPQGLYLENGTPRPSELIENSPNATVVDEKMTAVLMGVASVVFV